MIVCSRRRRQIPAIRYVARCRVVTRVRVELGGTTEVLDRGITKMEEDREATDALVHAEARKYIEPAATRHNRNGTNASTCIYIYVYSD